MKSETHVFMETVKLAKPLFKGPSREIYLFEIMREVLGIQALRFKRSLESRELTLRLYRFRDLPALRTQFGSQAFPRSNGPKLQAFNSTWSFAGWVKSIFRVLYVLEVAEKGGRRIIGFLGLYDMKVGQSLWLSLGVFYPRDRRLGYGKRAVELLLDFLEREGIVKVVYVEVLKHNIHSLCFFQKIGFLAIPL